MSLDEIVREMKVIPVFDGFEVVSMEGKYLTSQYVPPDKETFGKDYVQKMHDKGFKFVEEFSDEKAEKYANLKKYSDCAISW